MSNVKDAVGLWREAGADLKGICKEKYLAIINIAIIKNMLINLWH